MRISIRISISIILFCSCATTRKVHTSKRTTLAPPELPAYAVDYSIVRIDTVGNYYILYGSRNNSIYKIISKKEIIKGCKRIAVESTYPLLLTSSLKWFANDDHYRNNTVPYCQLFDTESMICFEDGCIRDLYEAENIQGLCFIEK